MWASMFGCTRGDARDDIQHGLITDIIRLVRDALAVADDIYHITILSSIVECLDSLLNDNQPRLDMR
jgi:hypothetical protein